MRESADVRSLDALRDARAALTRFRETVRLALSEAVSDVQRTTWWVASDRKAHWKAQLRRRNELMQQARSELARAELAATGSMVSCREERGRVEKVKRAIEEAEEKLRTIGRWERALEREQSIFRAAMQPLSRAVEGDLPIADARLLSMMDALAKYVATAPPPSAPPPVEPPPADPPETDTP